MKRSQLFLETWIPEMTVQRTRDNFFKNKNFFWFSYTLSSVSNLLKNNFRKLMISPTFLNIFARKNDKCKNDNILEMANGKNR